MKLTKESQEVFCVLVLISLAWIIYTVNLETEISNGCCCSDEENDNQLPRLMFNLNSERR
jgi:hypothetical protein